MNILWLGPFRPKLIDYLRSVGDVVSFTDEPISTKSKNVRNAEFLISYGYRHIIQNSVLSLFPNKAINLHISFLPWNRGANPNLWSFLEDTPKGVTIHVLNCGIDLGDVLVQREVPNEDEDTLRTSYERLSNVIEELFISNWLRIRGQELIPIPQTGAASFHKAADSQKYEWLLNDGWDTPVKKLIGLALENGGIQ